MKRFLLSLWRVALPWLAAVAVLWLACVAGLFFSLFSNNARKVAHVVELPPGYVYLLEKSGHRAPVEKAFFASYHDGWLGDGEEATAYKVPAADFGALVAALKTEHPDYRWAEERAEGAFIRSLWPLFPPEFRPAPATLLFHGQSAAGVPDRTYYLDADKRVFFAVKVQF
jgi:hypothetical protein